MQWFELMGITAYPLALCSVLAVALVLERVVFMLRERGFTQEIYTQLATELDAARHKPKPLRDELVNCAIQEVYAPYTRGIRLLRIIATISPLLGLLGTMLGIISSFKVMARNTGPVTPSLIASGLWEAMLTTVVGLSIAIFTLLMAYFFNHIGENAMQRLCRKLNRHSLDIEMEKHEPLKVAA